MICSHGTSAVIPQVGQEEQHQSELISEEKKKGINMYAVFVHFGYSNKNNHRLGGL